MFNLFKSDPTKKLIKEHQILVEKAFQAQRNGKMALCGELTYKAEELWKKIEELKRKDQIKQP